MRDDAERLRDILIHHYFGIDLDAVWLVVEHDLPDLKLNVQAILRGLESSDES